MFIQLDAGMRQQVGDVMEKADAALRAADFIKRKRREALSDEQLYELAQIHSQMIWLLARFTDGDKSGHGFGAAPDSMLYALRGFEDAAHELLCDASLYCVNKRPI